MTIARFRAEHEAAISDLFRQVLLVCARAGMGRVGIVALDGTKIAADAALAANRTESRLREMAAEIVIEAGETDTAEDELFGDARGDELPAELADPHGRAARIKQMLDDLDAERAERDAQSGRAERTEARLAQLRDTLARTRAQVSEQARARAERDAAAAAAGTSIPGTRPVPVEQHARVRAARDRLAHAERAAAAGAEPTGPAAPKNEARRNLTDPDSRIMPTRGGGWVQGFNGQLVVSSDYLILAAQLTNDPTDPRYYQPMIDQACDAARAIRHATGRRTRIGTVLADAGYASDANLTAEGPDRLIALGKTRALAKAAQQQPAHGDPPPGATARERMDHRLRTPVGAARYKLRAATVEPVNAHLKDRRGLRRFSRRGLAAANSEFRFAAAITNLLRLHTQLAASVT